MGGDQLGYLQGTEDTGNNQRSSMGEDGSTKGRGSSRKPDLANNGSRADTICIIDYLLHNCNKKVPMPQ
jgi:hypothetical protein